METWCVAFSRAIWLLIWYSCNMLFNNTNNIYYYYLIILIILIIIICYGIVFQSKVLNCVESSTWSAWPAFYVYIYMYIHIYIYAYIYIYIHMYVYTWRTSCRRTWSRSSGPARPAASGTTTSCTPPAAWRRGAFRIRCTWYDVIWYDVDHLIDKT